MSTKLDLQTTQTLDPTVQTSHHANTMLATLQRQRDNLANEVVKAEADSALVQLSLASEIQVSRAAQAHLALEQKKNADLMDTITHMQEEAASIINQLEAAAMQDASLIEARGQELSTANAEIERLQRGMLPTAFGKVQISLATATPSVGFNTESVAALSTSDVQALSTEMVEALTFLLDDPTGVVACTSAISTCLPETTTFGTSGETASISGLGRPRQHDLSAA